MLESERLEQEAARARRSEATTVRGPALRVYAQLREAGVDVDVALQEVRRQGLEGAPSDNLSDDQTAALKELSKPARAIYESWRSVGHGHDEALEEVRRAGVGPDGAPTVETAQPFSEAEMDRTSARIFGRSVAPALDRTARPDLSESGSTYDVRSASVFGRRMGGV